MSSASWIIVSLDIPCIFLTPPPALRANIRARRAELPPLCENWVGLLAVTLQALSLPLLWAKVLSLPFWGGGELCPSLQQQQLGLRVKQVPDIHTVAKKGKQMSPYSYQLISPQRILCLTLVSVIVDQKLIGKGRFVSRRTQEPAVGAGVVRNPGHLDDVNEQMILATGSWLGLEWVGTNIRLCSQRRQAMTITRAKVSTEHTGMKKHIFCNIKKGEEACLWPRE